jgi:GNAT superfamily N-acetyltransferase
MHIQPNNTSFHPSYRIAELNELPVEKTEEFFHVVNDCWNHAHSYYLVEERHDRYASIEQLKTEALKSKVYVLLDQHSGKIGGGVQFNTTYQNVNAYFGTLFIHKEYQGKGLAERLIKYVEKEAFKCHKQHLYIWVVDCADKLKKFYQGLGFIFTGKVISRDSSFLDRVKPDFKKRVNFQEMVKLLHSESKL